MNKDILPPLYYLQVKTQIKKTETSRKHLGHKFPPKITTTIVYNRYKLWGQESERYQDIYQNLDEFGEPSLEYLIRIFGCQRQYFDECEDSQIYEETVVVGGEIKRYRPWIKEQLQLMSQVQQMSPVPSFSHRYYLMVELECKRTESCNCGAYNYLPSKTETKLVRRRFKLWTEEGKQFHDLYKNLDEFGQPNLDYLKRYLSLSYIHDQDNLEIHEEHIVIGGEIKLYRPPPSIKYQLQQKLNLFNYQPVPIVNDPPVPIVSDPVNLSDPKQVYEENLKRLQHFYEQLVPPPSSLSNKMIMRVKLLSKYRKSLPYSQLMLEIKAKYGKSPQFLETRNHSPN